MNPERANKFVLISNLRRTFYCRIFDYNDLKNYIYKDMHGYYNEEYSKGEHKDFYAFQLSFASYYNDEPKNFNVTVGPLDQNENPYVLEGNNVIFVECKTIVPKYCLNGYQQFYIRSVEKLKEIFLQVERQSQGQDKIRCARYLEEINYIDQHKIKLENSLKEVLQCTTENLTFKKADSSIVTLQKPKEKSGGCF